MLFVNCRHQVITQIGQMYVYKTKYKFDKYVDMYKNVEKIILN
jgi:hypothetical protein